MQAASAKLFDAVINQTTATQPEFTKEELFAREAVKRYLTQWSEANFAIKCASHTEKYISEHGEASFYSKAVSAAISETERDFGGDTRVVHLGGGSGRTLLACGDALRQSGASSECIVEAFTGRHPAHIVTSVCD